MAGKVICDYINNDNIAGGFLGIGQTWQDVTASRSLGVTYTNTSGKPIIVCCSPGDVGTHEFIVNGLIVDRLYNTAGNGTGMVIVVPSGATYSVTGGTAINTWSELR